MENFEARIRVVYTCRGHQRTLIGDVAKASDSISCITSSAITALTGEPITQPVDGNVLHRT